MVEKKVIYLLYMYKNHYNQQVHQNIEQKLLVNKKYLIMIILSINFNVMKIKKM